MFEVFLNRNQLLAFLIAVLALWILLRSATAAQRDEQALSWAVSIQAFGLAALVWAVISFVRAPFIITREDREKGRWHGSRFVYHQPQLVAVERCLATGKLERFKIRFDDAEAGSFFYMHIEVENEFVLPRMFVGVFTEIWFDPRYGQSHLRAGMYLPKDRTAYLAVRMMEKTIPQTIRVYLDEWTVGDPLDQDGSPGRPDKAISLS